MAIQFVDIDGKMNIYIYLSIYLSYLFFLWEYNDWVFTFSYATQYLDTQKTLIYLELKWVGFLRNKYFYTNFHHL